MGVVIEICVKHPGGPTRIRGTEISSMKSMAWTRERIAYDLIGHK
jgi:hypothetical protein